MPAPPTVLAVCCQAPDSHERRLTIGTVEQELCRPMSRPVLRHVYCGNAPRLHSTSEGRCDGRWIATIDEVVHIPGPEATVGDDFSRPGCLHRIESSDGDLERDGTAHIQFVLASNPLDLGQHLLATAVDKGDSARKGRQPTSKNKRSVQFSHATTVVETPPTAPDCPKSLNFDHALKPRVHTGWVATTNLYRPVGQPQLGLIAASEWRRFPRHRHGTELVALDEGVA